jgi:PTH2 family peptidyl-tRNA hydrolase
MGAGKLAAQVGHAVLGAYKRIIKQSSQQSVVESWENNGQPKIVLKVNSEKELTELENKVGNCEIGKECRVEYLFDH